MKTSALICGLLLMVIPLYSQEVTIDPTTKPVTVKTTEHILKEKQISFLFTKAMPDTLKMKISLLNARDTVMEVLEVSATAKTSEKQFAGLTAPSVREPVIWKLFIKADTVKRIRILFTSKQTTVLIFDLKNSSEGFVKNNEAVRPNQCSVTDDSNTRYFIPHRLTASTFSQPCVNCLNDYKVVYDLSHDEPHICYYKKVKCKKKTEQIENCNCKDSVGYYYKALKLKKRFRPAVGKNVGFHIFGYYPDFDSLSVAFGFDSRNLENRDAFAAAVSAGNQQEPAEEVEEKTESVLTVTAKSLTSDTAFFKKMRNEFREYYQYLLTETPSSGLIKTDVAHINHMLNQYCLSVKQYSSAGLLAAATEHVNAYDKVEEKELKKVVLKLASEAALYYGFILQYSSIKIPVVQMQNEDQFQWTVNFYRNKTTLHSQKYTALIKGGWKIDFSTGFVFNRLVDNKYTIQYDKVDITPTNGVSDSISAARIIRQNEGKYVVDVGIMSHIYPRTGTRVNVGATTGIVVRNGNSVKYILGASVMLGYEQRFILSAGWAGGMVQVLDETYNDAYYNYVSQSRLTAISSSIPTVNQWQWRGYFALTYNLGGTSLGGK